MAENTIQVKAYFPTGAWATVSLVFDSLDTMPTADDIIAGVEAKGFSIDFAGVEVGDKIQTVTHVMHRVKMNKDGSETPVIALYHENVGMKYKLDHKYLNNSDDIAEFESVSGMKLSDIPVYDGEAFLPRDHAKANRYVIQMPKPVKVATYEGEYEFNGKTDTKDYIRNFIGASNQPVTPANVTDMPTSTRQQERQSEQQTASAGWLKNDDALEKVKTQLTFFELNYGKDVLTDARKTVIAGGYDTPDLYLEALENQIKAIGA